MFVLAVQCTCIVRALQQCLDDILSMFVCVWVMCLCDLCVCVSVSERDGHS